MYNYNSGYPKYPIPPAYPTPDRMMQFQPQPQYQMSQNMMTMQPQQTSNPMQNANIPYGKIVDSIDAVKATDIPMDGNLYYFPKADGTELYAKRWLANGTTEIITYVPTPLVTNDNSLNTQQNLQIELPHEVTEMFTQRFDELSEKIGQLEKSLSITGTAKTSTASKAKKESE